MSVRTVRFAAALALAVLAGAGSALAQDAGESPPAPTPPPVFTLPTLEIIGTTPVQGVGIERDKVPANVQTVPSSQLDRPAAATLSDILNSSVGSVTVNDVTVNPFQPDISFRGFTASPLLGVPQGIAIYQNGVRVNEPFGDTVQWDVVPEFAIDSVQVIPGANPVFGLNALGGAIALQMKNGFNFKGFSAEGSGGSWGRKQGTMEYGAKEGNVGFYFGGTGFDEDGWRQMSPSKVGQAYADTRWRGDDGEAGLSFGYATSKLSGVQPSPVQLLDEDWTAAFTTPDVTKNELIALTGDANYFVSDTVSVQGNLHMRRLVSHGLNSNTAEFTDCGPLGGPAGLLCDPNSGTPAAPITSLNGDPIPTSFGGSGVDVTSQTDTMFYGGSLQSTISDDLFGHTNQFVVGTSLDFANVGYHNEGDIGFLNADRFVVPSGILLSGDDFNTSLDTKNMYYGAYFSDTFSITDALAATLSGRYNIATLEIIDHLGQSLNSDNEFIRFNPSAGLTYKVADNVTTYFNYSEANRAPTAVELSCADPTQPCRVPNAFLSDPPLRQVVNRSVEVGAHGHLKAWEGKAPIAWSADIFGSRNYSDIIFVSQGAGAGGGFFQNAGITQRVGAELNLNGTVGDFDWYLDYAFIRATFESNLTINSPFNPGADANGNIRVTPGDGIPGIPLHSAKAGVGYNVTDKWNVGLESMINSGVFLRGDEANLLSQTDAYAVFNLRSTYKITDYLEAFAKIDNIFDTRFETFGTLGDPSAVLPGFSDPRFLSPGAPIGAWAGLRVRI